MIQRNLAQDIYVYEEEAIKLVPSSARRKQLRAALLCAACSEVVLQAHYPDQLKSVSETEVAFMGKEASDKFENKTGWWNHWVHLLTVFTNQNVR